VLYKKMRHFTNKMEYIFILCLAFILITKAQNLYDNQILEENAMAQQTSSNIFDPTNTYAFDFPLPQDFRISIFIDPCRFNAYNCCINVFGAAEYPALRVSGLEPERAKVVTVIATDTEVAINYDLVYEDGSPVAVTNQRAADDETVIDVTCGEKGFDIQGQPSSFCAGLDYSFVRSPYRPPCSDNNFSLNALAVCTDVHGNVRNNCVQIGYTQNAYIGQCSYVDGNCGTYLEVHMPNGSPYHLENDVIASVLIDQTNVTGVYTTTMPTTWMGNSSKVLCSYSQSFFRVGDAVYIMPTSPQCCCPKPYSFTSSARLGSFFCPYGPSGSGPFASFDRTVLDSVAVDVLNQAYPFCPTDRSWPDSLACSVRDTLNERHYTRPCAAVNYSTGMNEHLSLYGSSVPGWTSTDLNGRGYFPPPEANSGICPFSIGCVRTANSTCKADDNLFSFTGQVGVVTAMDNLAPVPQISVSFNGGRTSYGFDQRFVKLNKPQKSEYEIWWVLRTKSGRTVQKRKGFNVTSPSCTFDEANNRYFPYALLDAANIPKGALSGAGGVRGGSYQGLSNLNP